MPRGIVRMAEGAVVEVDATALSVDAGAMVAAVQQRLVKRNGLRLKTAKQRLKPASVRKLPFRVKSFRPPRPDHLPSRRRTSLILKKEARSEIARRVSLSATIAATA